MIYNHFLFLFVLKWSGMFIYHVQLPFKEEQMHVNLFERKSQFSVL